MANSSSPIGQAAARMRVRDQIQNDAILIMTGTLQAIATGDWNPPIDPSDEDPVLLTQILAGALGIRDIDMIATTTSALVDTAFCASRTGEFAPQTHKGIAFLDLIHGCIEARLDRVEAQIAAQFPDT